MGKLQGKIRTYLWRGGIRPKLLKLQDLVHSSSFGVGVLGPVVAEELESRSPGEAAGAAGESANLVMDPIIVKFQAGFLREALAAYSNKTKKINKNIWTVASRNGGLLAGPLFLNGGPRLGQKVVNFPVRDHVGPQGESLATNWAVKPLRKVGDLGVVFKAFLVGA